MNQTNTVWVAEYDECIHEGGFSVISLHDRRFKAEKAMKYHKKNYLKDVGQKRAHSWQAWRVVKYYIQR